MRKYTSTQIVNMVSNNLKPLETLYQKPFVNYLGKTSNTNEYYTEIVAGILLNNNFAQQLKNVPPINRKNYNVNHTGVISTGRLTSNRKEERFAISLFNLSKYYGIKFRYLGKVIDYQVPLKRSNQDKNVGKIDMISQTDDEIWLLELKNFDSKDTLLKCVLEISTYYQLLNKNNFLKKSYQEFSKFKPCQIKKGVVIFENSLQYKEFREMKHCDRPNLMSLIKALNVEIFVVEKIFR